MTHTTRLSTTMRLSWSIQKGKHTTRSYALQSAWAITNHADEAVHYLVKRHSHERYPNKVNPQELTLFR